MRKKCSFLKAALFFVVLFHASSYAVLLSDGQLYFDPATLEEADYPKVYLPDLLADNTAEWTASGDPITDADILPILKPGDYLKGYVFSQTDYLEQPNVDYWADLTAGDLTVTFHTAGLYHVRITRASSAVEIYAVFAEADYKPSAPTSTGPKKKIDPTPTADLFVVENSDTTMDNSNEIWKKNGQATERVDNVAQTVQKIKEKSKALGRKLHVELDGHGAAGIIAQGEGKSSTPIPGERVDLKNAAAFQESIDDYVNHITFQGCSVGKGKKGKEFLQIMADSIGKAGAWDCPVTTVNQSHFAIPLSGKWVEVVADPKATYVIPVVINLVGTTTCDVKKLIAETNKKLKGSGIKLELKKTNPNTVLGDGDNKITVGTEYSEACEKAEAELAKLIKGKNGKWNGKGLKIYVADDHYTEKPTSDGWHEPMGNTGAIKKKANVTELAEILKKLIKKGFPRGRVGTPEPENEKAVAKATAKKKGKPVKTKNPSKVTAGAGTSEKSKISKMYSAAGIKDSLNDTSGGSGTHEHAYADITHVSLSGDKLTDASSKTTVEIALNGRFPGTLPSIVAPENPDREFEATYTLELDKPSGFEQFFITVWKDFPGQDYQSQITYAGTSPGGYIGSVEIFENSIIDIDPNEPIEGGYANILEFEVDTSFFWGPVDDMTIPINLMCNSSVLDGGLTITDTAEDIDGAMFEYSVVLPEENEIPSLVLVGPSTEPDGRGLAVKGTGFPAGQSVELFIDEMPAGIATADGNGDIFLFADTAIPFDVGSHDIQAVAMESQPDGTFDWTMADTEIIYLENDIESDLDLDGRVDLQDYVILAEDWLRGI